MTRVLALLLLLAAFAAAQDDGCGEGCDDGGGGILTDEDFIEEGGLEVVVDPFDVLEEEAQEPNRPDPVKVGVWPAPELTDEAGKALDRLLEARAAAPDDVAARYRLAEFYVLHQWWPHAEAEFFKCAELDPESVRPWQGLLQVYLQVPEMDDELAELIVILGQQGVVLEEPAGRRQVDWLPSREERSKRITHAYRGFLRRRPDDVARRRAFLHHLKSLGDHAGAAEQAREILVRLPDDADTRFELAEAVRRVGVRREARKLAAAAAAAGGDMEESVEDSAPLPNAVDTPEFAEAMALLEENLRRAPHHAPSALRLARMICAKDPSQVKGRVLDLEMRGLFHLFVERELGQVEFRADTVRMVLQLGGKPTAVRLWEEAMRPPSFPRWGTVRHYMPFVSDPTFENALPRDRIAACEMLARRGDREAAVMLLSYLWHLDGPELYREDLPDQMDAFRGMEAAAVHAAVSIGAASYPVAESFLRMAETPWHRRRAVWLMRGLLDRRALRPLLEALAWETREEESYGVAAALEALADPQCIDGLVDAALDVRRPLARRREAAEALGAFKDARSVAALGKLAKEDGFGLVSAYGLFRLTGDDAARARLAHSLKEGEDSLGTVRLLAKCESGDALAQLLLDGFVESVPVARPAILEVLKARFWDRSKERVREALLRAAETGNVQDYVLEELGAMGGPEAAERLLNLVQGTKDPEFWAKAARALARTGDARAVQHFNRARILEKDPGRRRLAELLYEEAQAERARREKAAGE